MTKKDLKNGMIVETRNKSKFLIHNERCIDRLGGFPISTINDDLTDIDGNKIWDIVGVYNSEALSILGLFEDNNLELIWERDAEIIKVGDKVKVIDNGPLYTRYNEWVERNIADIDDRYKFDMGHKIDNDVKCKVLYIAKHGKGHNADDTLAYVRNLETNRCYLISVEGLKKVGE